MIAQTTLPVGHNPPPTRPWPTNPDGSPTAVGILVRRCLIGAVLVGALAAPILIYALR